MDAEEEIAKLFDRYDILSSDVKYQVNNFISDYYEMNFDFLKGTIDELIELQEKIREFSPNTPNNNVTVIE